MPESPSLYPRPPLTPPTAEDLRQALDSMILSASGWRKVYGADDEDRTTELRPVDTVLGYGMARAYADMLGELGSGPGHRVAVGTDSRFSGPALADAMIRILLSQGFEVDYLGIVAAPEIMAWVQGAQGHRGFVYVSASHNPLGHNGVKFGLGTGGVVGGAEAAQLIARFRGSVTPENARSWIAAAKAVPQGRVDDVYARIPGAREAAARAYRSLCDEILTGTPVPGEQQARKSGLAALVRARGLGVVGELNGSARGRSIDRSWLADLGIQVLTLNDQPQEFVHRIVPEGSSLDLCREELGRAHRNNPAFQIGYVPDCDGDRGNVVFYDPTQGQARALEAQEGFALCVLSELAGLAYYGDTGPRVAVACNDPTSFRIDAIAQAFGATVARAEVGEANVVQRARELRQEGWTVRILGEGSNGGNITFPGSVRDPLSTLGSLVKLLSLRSTPGRPGLFELWCQRSGQPKAYRPDYTLADVVATLPRWTTTPTSEDRAMMRIQTTSHQALKAAFEARWPQAWDARRTRLEALGIVTWEELNYEGTREIPGFGPSFRSGRHSGGLKLVFRDAQSLPVGCLWMRGSGTEPVFRILAEVRGDNPAGEAELLEWLRGLVHKADQAASSDREPAGS